MKISQILTSLRNDCSAQMLQVTLQEAMLDGTFLSGRQTVNEDEATESEGLYISFEIQTVLSSDFAIEIRPQIRAGSISAVVHLVRFHDSAGQASSDFGSFKLKGFEATEEVSADEDEEVASFVQRIRQRVLDLHIDLIEAAGVSSKQARHLAEAYWPVAAA